MLSLNIGVASFLSGNDFPNSNLIKDEEIWLNAPIFFLNTLAFDTVLLILNR